MTKEFHSIDYNDGQIYVQPILSEPIGKTVIYTEVNEVFVYANGNGFEPDVDFVVVAQSSNLSLPNIPYVEIEEEDVEQLGKNEIAAIPHFPKDLTDFALAWFKIGYKAASAKYGK